MQFLNADGELEAEVLKRAQDGLYRCPHCHEGHLRDPRRLVNEHMLRQCPQFADFCQRRHIKYHAYYVEFNEIAEHEPD